MKNKIFLDRFKSMMISIDSLITLLDSYMQSRDFAKIASEVKRGETELMKFKILLAGMKKIEFEDEEKKEIENIVLPIKQKIKRLSVISQTNASFYSSFLNVISALISASYNDKGKMSVQINNNRISHSI
jgi:hypothetical protein